MSQFPQPRFPLHYCIPSEGSPIELTKFLIHIQYGRRYTFFTWTIKQLNLTKI